MTRPTRSMLALAAITAAVPALLAAPSAAARSGDATPPTVYGGPALTSYDSPSGKTIVAGYEVERQALRAKTGSASVAPYQDEATIVQPNGHRVKVSSGGATTSGYAGTDPRVLTSFSMGQDQNDYGTLAVTDNVTAARDGSLIRHASGPVWVEAHCAKGVGYCWNDLGGSAASAPSVVNADGTVWVLARFGRGVKARARRRGASGWSPWRSVGTNVSLVDAPAATTVSASGGSDNIELFATGVNGQLYDEAISGVGKSGRRGTPAGRWSLLSRSVDSSVAPAAAYNEPSRRLTLVVVSKTGVVLSSEDNGKTWQARHGATSAKFAPAALGDNLTNAVDIAVRGTDNRTWVAASSNGGRSFSVWTQVPCTVDGSSTVC